MSVLREPTDEQALEEDVQSMGMERLVFFSDAVFAIAITLLALDIRLPEGSEDLSAAVLREQLLALGPQYEGYVLSFVVIGLFWWGHHAKFRIINRYDGGLFWLNLLLLMVIAFVPFPTSVLSANGNSTATIFYALTMATAGLLSALINVYANRGHRLVRAGYTFDLGSGGTLVSLVITAVFLASIPIALFSADLAKYSWLLAIPLQVAAGRIRPPRRQSRADARSSQ